MCCYLPIVLIRMQLGVLQPEFLGKEHESIHGSLPLLIHQLELLHALGR